MRNLSVFIENNDCVVDLDVPIMKPETMTLRHVTIFWKYDNVTTENNSITLGSKEIVLEPGYWDFEMIKDRLSSENIVLTRNNPSRTCDILAKGDNLNLKHFGELLGFEPLKVITADINTKSTKQVDILRGLRYINIKCDAVNQRESTSVGGARGGLLACVPVVSYAPLNSSATEYFDLNSMVVLRSGNLIRLRFKIDSNVDHAVRVDALLNIVIE